MTGYRTTAPVATDRTNPAWLATLGLAILLVVSLVARLWYSSIVPLSYDETHNLMIGVLANEGHVPYREIYSVIMPFSILIMRASAALWGATQHVRTLMMLLGLMGVSAVYYLVYSQSRSLPVLAALFAATFFSFNPHYFFVSTSINLEAGALAWGLLSVVLVEVYRRRGANSNLWLLLAGGAFGLSTAVKVFVPFIPAVVGLQLLLIQVADHGRSPRKPGTYWTLLKLGIIWAAGVVAALAAFLLLFDRSALIEQVLASRFALREAINVDAEVNIAESLNPSDIVQYIPLLVISLTGLLALWRQRLVHAWIWPAWFLFACAFLLTHDPVRPRHTVMALPPLAALGGIGFAYLLAQLSRRDQSAARWAVPLLAAVALILPILAPVNLVDTESFTDHHPVRLAAIDFVQQTTAPGDCVISKENRLLFLAGRLTTPHLSLISTARLFSGLLPAKDIAQEAETHDCPVLVYADTFDRIIPDLRLELQDVYSLRLTLVDPIEPDYPLEIYAVQLDDGRLPEYAQTLKIGDAIEYRGYNLTGEPWLPGQTLYLSTYWQAKKPMQTDYKVFVHLLDNAGNEVANFDHYPFSLDPSLPVNNIEINPAYLADGGALPEHYPATGMIPTRRWIPDRTLVETVALALPDDLPAGEYSLSLGMYNEQSMQRLPVSGPGVESDQIVIGGIWVD
ncbi:MAG: hypothetical protein ACK2UO_21465 [Caldilineaceae bacterium]